MGNSKFLNSFTLRIAVVIIVFIILFSFGFSDLYKSGDAQEVSNSKVLDNLGPVPEWLKLNVDEALPLDSLNIWIPTDNFQSSALIRVPRFPRVYSEAEIHENPALRQFQIHTISKCDTLKISAVRNEQVSAQIALGARMDLKNVKVTIGKMLGLNGNVNSQIGVDVRYPKYVPVQRARSEFVWSPKLERVIGEEVSGNFAPNVVADPLISMEAIDVPAFRAQPIWITFRIPENVATGKYSCEIVIASDSFREHRQKIELEILSPTLPPVNQWKFHLDLWVNPSAIADYYKLPHWSKAHFDLIFTYLKEYASAGGKNILTTITHEPWHKPWINHKTRSQVEFGYRSMVKWIKTEQGNWEFDYSIFDKYVSLARKAGLAGNINAFSMTPFHTKQCIKYFDEPEGIDKELILDIGDDTYQELWVLFLTDFKDHLKKVGLFEKTYLGFDEKPDSTMSVLRRIIEKAAPEFLDKIVIAGHPEAHLMAQDVSISYVFFPGQQYENRTNVQFEEVFIDRKESNKITTFYLCAEPSHPNTLTFSPAVESRLVPWLALKFNTDGYLRWAFNNWTSDPFEKPVFIHSQGDDYYIYPGEGEPISSIRWELLKEGIEDFELFHVKRDDGHFDLRKQAEAIEFATRNQDGRYKLVSDMLMARKAILSKQRYHE
ncbi:MAG: DUF4091 domain-containing protein [Cytophagales bacterium]|nr:DUF4091 domain-containing protein [Cytophagales bacterium]